MSVNKRLVEYHIARLEDKNAEVRVKAIKELELLADPDVLDTLKNIFDTDPDPDVRAAAREAGRTIFVKSRGAEDSQA